MNLKKSLLVYLFIGLGLNLPVLADQLVPQKTDTLLNKIKRATPAFLMLTAPMVILYCTCPGVRSFVRENHKYGGCIGDACSLFAGISVSGPLLGLSLFPLHIYVAFKEQKQRKKYNKKN
ncbi:MAG TPA: hypothetical protein VFF04_06080 [Candidatus Babeliales bacterium]|nr:hypothetical protein [Candidatus Babeliales bacterium]